MSLHKNRKNNKGVSTNNSLTAFNSGYLQAKFFENAEGDDTGGVVKHALVAYEGSFKDSNGREHSFDTDRLSTIADHTNKALESGTIVPLCTDHEKTVNHTVGTVEGTAYTKAITEADLPNPKAKHLLGKMGLFLDNVKVKAQDAIDKVTNGIVTSVSMGLNLDPKDHRIVELSLVPVPAIPNMGLFRKNLGNVVVFGLDGTDENNLYTWEDLEADEQTLDDLKEQYDDLTEKLWTLLNNIYSSESADITDVQTLQQYVTSALNGFSLRTLDILGLSNVPQGVPGQDPGALDANQQQQMAETQAAGVSQPGLDSQNVTYSAPKGLLTFAKYNRLVKYIKQ